MSNYIQSIIALPMILFLFLSAFLTLSMLADGNQDLDNDMLMLVFSTASTVCSMIGLYFLVLLKRKENHQKELLENLVYVISNKSSEYIYKKNTLDYQSVFKYIESCYTTLVEKENVIRIENKTSTDLLHNLSYEILTPMNAIFGHTKLLKETHLDREQHDLIAIIEDSYENLDSILSNVSLDVSLSREKFETINTSFNIVKKIESTVETFSVRADQKDILLGLYIDPSLPHHLRGDSIKLAQIMNNLIDNALESSNAYDTIEISIERLESKRNDEVNIKFTVHDKGIGFDQGEIKNIRKMLHKMEVVENIFTLDTNNLIMSNKVLKRLGSKLELSSQKGEGSSFFFTLCLEKDNMQIDKDSPTLNQFTVGLALPSKDICRKIDENLKIYIEYFGGTFSIYEYDTLFNDSNEKQKLPDLMFIYHNYTKNKGELEALGHLPCKTTLITSSSLRSQINIDKHLFSNIVYAPITMSKVLRFIPTIKENKSINICKNIVPSKKKYTFGTVQALVVEDNDISKNIIANILRKMQINVMVASNGKEAYELRRKNNFNIIFMDVNMPIMNGFEATTKILTYEKVNQCKHIPIVAMATDNTGKYKYIQAGMSDFINKPIDADKIYAIVEKYCIA